MKRKLLLLAWIFVIVAQNLYSQEVRLRTAVSFKINSAVIDSVYVDNLERLVAIEAFLRSLSADSLQRLVQMHIEGYASPDGSLELNHDLARRRQEALERWIRNRYCFADTLVVKRDNFISWKYFISLVEKSDFVEKDTVLKILWREPKIVKYGKRHVDHRVLALKRLYGGRLWNELNDLFFEEMRKACVTFVIVPDNLIGGNVEENAIDTLKTSAMEKSAIVEQSVAMPSGQQPAQQEIDYWRKLHLKTNLVGWGLLISNAAVEVDLWKHWSFAFSVYYSGWDYFVQKIKFRTVAIQPEFRYWFRDNDGWFVGAHMSVAYFNMALNQEYRVQDLGRETPALGGGLSGGYRMWLGKSKHWKMEFALGAGAYRVHYDRFRNVQDGLLVDYKKRTYIGIDNLSVSLAYMFNLKKRSK